MDFGKVCRLGENDSGIGKGFRKLSRDLHRQRVHCAACAPGFEGTAERPRLCVYRSLGHIYAQVIERPFRQDAGFRQFRLTANRKKNLKGGGKRRGGKR